MTDLLTGYVSYLDFVKCLLLEMFGFISSEQSRTQSEFISLLQRACERSREHAVRAAPQHLDDALSVHSLKNLLEARDVSARNVVAFHIVALSSVVDVVVEVYHDVL